MRRAGRNRLWTVLAFLLLTLAVVYAAFILLYRSYRDRLEFEMGERLVAVASATAAAVNDGVWDGITAGDSAAVARVRTELEEIRLVNGVSNLFLFDLGEITRLDLGGQYPVGQPNVAAVQDVEPVTSALAGLPSATPLYSSEGDHFKSAYAAVLDVDGLPVGGVGVEASATFFGALEQVRRTLILSSLAVLAGVLVLGAVFLRAVLAQEALERALRRNEALAGMGQMAAMLAHEIRNPLGIIRGSAERLAARYELADDEIYRFIPEEVDRLEATLGSYLDFARPAASGHGDAARALRRTLDLTAAELERRGIAVAVGLPAGEVPVGGDEHALQQVFLNLILNARDAMSAGGTLSGELVADAAHVTVTLTDTGTGMDAATLVRATDPFFTSKESGSGLGLAVVRRVVDDLGGRLDLQSVPGQGTTVTVTLPRAAHGSGNDA